MAECQKCQGKIDQARRSLVGRFSTVKIVEMINGGKLKLGTMINAVLSQSLQMFRRIRLKMSSLFDKHFSDSPAGWIVPWEKTTPQGKIDLSGFSACSFYSPFSDSLDLLASNFPKGIIYEFHG